MLPQGFQILKQKIYSNASRRKTWHSNTLNLNWGVGKLSFIYHSKGGRDSMGRKILRTRGSRMWRFKRPILTYSPWTKLYVFSVDFLIDCYTSRYVSLLCGSNGSLLFIPSFSTENKFVYSKLFHLNSISFKNINVLFSIIGGIPKLTLVSLLEITPHKGAQYARSRGSRARIFSFNYDRRFALIILPSKLSKNFSLYASAAIAPILGLGIKRENTRAGYWRSLGFKGVSRGVARNPVDHPHGGRTKTLKCPRTPWGKITKFK